VQIRLTGCALFVTNELAIILFYKVLEVEVSLSRPKEKKKLHQSFQGAKKKFK